MELANVKQLFVNFHCNDPVTSIALQRFASDSEFQLPQDYVQLLQQMNGGEGFIGSKKKEYVILWPIEDLLRLNQAYEVAEYAPGLFLFGSNGGGDAYAFDRNARDSIVTVPFVGMDISLVQLQAPSFKEFIERLVRT